jgi:sensor histidine kinase YesM
LDTESKNYGTLIFVIGIYYCWYLLIFNILLTHIFKARFWKLIWLSVFYIFLVTISLFLLDYFNFLYVPLLKSEAATSSRVMGIYFVCTSCVFFIGLGAKRIIEGIEENIISEKNAIGMQAAEIKALRLQINPHFLSNAHTKLNSLIRTDNIDKAIEYNTKIAALFRDTLASSTSEFTSLEAEFKWLQNYLEVEKDLFENLFNFSIETNNLPTGDFLFPSMLLQPLVENSIIHGFLPEWHKKV